jgi:MFS family permease
VTKSWKKLFSNREFIYIWLSQILSQITINILNFTLLFSLFEKTNSSIATSFLWISFALPAIIIGPFASALVDMTDRKKVLYISNLLQSLVVLFYVIWINSTPFFVYTFVIIYSAINQFYVPAEFATLPHVVRKKILPEANGLFLITQQGSIVIGFGFAGIILNFIGFQDTILTCSVLLFIAFLSTLLLPQMKTKNNMPKRIDEVIKSFFENIYLGYSFIAKNKMILGPFLIMLAMQVMLAITTVNTPAMAHELFKIPLNYAGMFLILPAGIGALISSIFIPRLLKKGIRKVKIIEYSLFFLSVSLAFAIFIFTYLPEPLRLFFSFLSLIISGISFIGILIPSQTLLQEKTPHELRGRVFGNFWFLVTIASVFPVILSGTITEIFGSRILMLVIVGLTFVFYVFLKDYSKKYLLIKD